jgi:hypothetical protein
MDKTMKTKMSDLIEQDKAYVCEVQYILHDTIVNDNAWDNTPVGKQAKKVAKELKLLREELDKVLQSIYNA